MDSFFVVVASWLRIMRPSTVKVKVIHSIHLDRLLHRSVYRHASSSCPLTLAFDRHRAATSVKSCSLQWERTEVIDQRKWGRACSCPTAYWSKWNSNKHNANRHADADDVMMAPMTSQLVTETSLQDWVRVRTYERKILARTIQASSCSIIDTFQGCTCNNTHATLLANTHGCHHGYELAPVLFKFCLYWSFPN